MSGFDFQDIKSKVRKNEKKQINNFLYQYGYDQNERLLCVSVFEKKRIFKSYYGDYIFQYSNEGLLNRQTSYIKDLGITEYINYEYSDKKQLERVYYYNEKNHLRYTVQFSYEEGSKIPKSVNIIRMEKFPFFESQNPDFMKKYFNILGKDFEGSFFLLDLVDEFGQ